MRLSFLLFAFIAAHCETFDSDSQGVSKEATKAGKLYEVSSVNLENSEEGAGLPKSRKITVEADGQRFTVDIELVSVFSDRTTIQFHHEDGNVEYTPVEERSYRGTGVVSGIDNEDLEEITHAAVTFHQQDGKDVFDGVFRTKNDLYTLSPIRMHEHEDLPVEIRRRVEIFGGAENLGVSMVMHRATEDLVFHNESNEWIKGDASRRLLAIDVWTNCYPDQNQGIQLISTGMLIDNGYLNRVGGTAAAARDDVAKMINLSNNMYRGHMNVEIVVDEILMGNGVTGFNFNEAPTQPGRKTCPSGDGASSRLTKLRAWRQTYHRQNLGLWHLMTDCHPPAGTIGIAYVSALCHQFGVGLSSYTGTGTWQTVAHEFGHNFGSGHTFDKNLRGGIMDYGDGVYKGEYQIHIAHKGEVCREVAQAIENRRSIPTCFRAKEVDGPTPTPPAPPAPVTNPTPNPTPRPTPNPSPRPTPNPVAGPAPVTQPTPIPSTSNRFTWRTGAFQGCEPSCAMDFDDDGDVWSYNTRKIECYDSNEQEVVADFWCTGQGPKEVFNIRDRNSVEVCKSYKAAPFNIPDCVQECGDGILNPNEMCDATAVSSAEGVAKGIMAECCTDCNGWKQTDECIAANPFVDAGMMDSAGNVWIFQGDRVAKFDEIDGEALDGYPKTIENTFPGISDAFKGGIDAAVSLRDMTALLIKGVEYVLVDLEDGQVNDAPNHLCELRGITQCTSTAGSGDQFLGCSVIDAAISFEDHAYFICGSVAFRYGHGVGLHSYQPLAGYFPGIVFSDSIKANAISAAVRDREDGVIKFFKSYENMEWFASSVVESANPTTGIGAAPSDGEKCAVDFCSACSVDGLLCVTCLEGYKNKRGGKRCKRRKGLVADLDFDSDDWKTTLCEAAFGPENCGTDDVEQNFVSSNYATETSESSAFGKSGSFSGTERMALTPVCKLMRNWEVSFWWMPAEGSQTMGDGIPNRFLTIMRDRHDTGAQEPFTISFDHFSRIQNKDVGKDFVTKINMFGNYHECYVDTPIETDKWNKISITFNDGIMTTMANGNFHQIAFETAGEPDMRVDFCNWWLGDDVIGIHGKVDNFQVTCLDEGCLEHGSDNKKATYAIIGVAVGASVGGCCLIGLLWYFGCCGFAYAKLRRDSSASQEGRSSYRPYSPKANNFVTNNRAPKPPASKPPTFPAGNENVEYLGTQGSEDKRHRSSFKTNGIGARAPPPPRPVVV